jgi:hypothetical protein
MDRKNGAGCPRKPGGERPAENGDVVVHDKEYRVAATADPRGDAGGRERIESER